ncbi:glycosyltransferase [Corynebacterium aurimucosum]|uniref:glycosyltransferase n=1 Tax=Corynebacterium aurimucosum TaxID=169292 RepID=UPI003990A145
MRIKTEYLRGVALLSEFAINPVAFLEKMALKLPQYSGILAALKHALTSLVSAELRELLIIRDFDAALRITPRWNPILASWLKREIRELERPVLPSIPQAGLSRRVLYLATNSWPYTNSGYALRTQKVAATLHAQGLDIIVVTRLGYPFVVGKRVNEHDESIDGVQYRRMVTFWGQLTSTARFERAAQQLERVARETSASEILCTTDFRNAQLASYVAERLGIPWTYEVRGEAHNTWLSTLPEPLAVRARRGLYYSQAQRLEREAVCAARGWRSSASRPSFLNGRKLARLLRCGYQTGLMRLCLSSRRRPPKPKARWVFPKGFMWARSRRLCPMKGWIS